MHAGHPVERRVETVGARVARLRLEKGLGQRELADGLDHCTRSYISRIEAGERNPSIRALVEIGGKLDTTALYLLTGEEDRRSPVCER
jgi:transcriptional regulator with XRE-family HTH domain